MHKIRKHGKVCKLNVNIVETVAEAGRNWGNMRRASFKCENCGNYSGLKQINRMKYGKVKIEKVFFSPKKRSFFQVKDIWMQGKGEI